MSFNKVITLETGRFLAACTSNDKEDVASELNPKDGATVAATAKQRINDLIFDWLAP